MIDCIFTIDYEIYGNGTGALHELVYEPAERLKEVFRRFDARFVTFVEVAELEKIEAAGSDPAIDRVTRQIRELYRDGFEIALHLHPQWSRARHDQGRWLLDYAEYNLCTLPRERIEHIVEESLRYLRYVVDDPGFTPLSFRAGGWLFQPTRTAAAVLTGRGIRIDSSVFKGGVQHNHSLDYRAALKNGSYWRFSQDVNEPDPNGPWIEIPVHTEMVPFWTMLTSKRVGLQKRSGHGGRSGRHRVNRLRDFMRPRYPLKFDFCRMTLPELTSMMGKLIREDRNTDLYRPVVAIGHTKDLIDLHTVESFLSFLQQNGVAVSTFEQVFPKLLQAPVNTDHTHRPIVERLQAM